MLSTVSVFLNWVFVKSPCLSVCILYFSFSLNANSKNLLLMYHGQLTVCPHRLLCFFSSWGVICRTTGTSLRESVWIIFPLFVLFFYFCSLFSVLRRSLSQSCYYVNQRHIVSHFCLPGDRYRASWECKYNSVSYSISTVRPPYIVNLSDLFAYSWSYSYMHLCVGKKLFSLDYNKCRGVAIIQRPFDRSDESTVQSRSKSSKVNFKTIYIVETCHLDHFEQGDPGWQVLGERQTEKIALSPKSKPQSSTLPQNVA